MTKIAILSLVVLSSVSTEAAMCRGTLTVNNVGMVSEERATLMLLEDNGIYSGPHASIGLGKRVRLAFSQPNSTGWRLADLSSGNHGGELNQFFMRRATSTTPYNLEFMYRGSYGYVASGILECR